MKIIQDAIIANQEHIQMKEIQNVHHVQMELILMDLAHLYVIIAQVEHIHI